MKTLFKLAATLLLTWPAASPALAAPQANLTITAEQGQPFSLVLDGRLLTRPVAPQVRVALLAPGRHWAEFSVPTGYGPPMRFRTTVWLQPGLETDYVLLVRPYGPQLRQVGVLPIGSPAYGQGGYYDQGAAPYGNGQGSYNGPQGGYYGPGQTPPPAQGGYNNGGYDPRGAYPGNGQPQPYPAPVPNPTYPGQQPQSYPAPAPAPAYPGNGQPQSNSGDYNNAPAGSYPDTTANGGYDPNSAPNSVANLQPLAPADVEGLSQDLRQRATDEERLRTATQALDQSSLSADELAELVRTFVHDESRIELARFGYSHLSDPQNFSHVYSALQFKSSIRTLKQAVGLPQD
ncbi:DUF4476 domain-containing protein [Hymenobacter sp. BRD67]|uniref:DUF4476 domain-containing protein n=1 Tax=Hymenobacter sp. BRD67 TaxID=2675877 RepID=UPI001565AC74|nr:DUF4476 domain-containing protein [Hymenobacter sp. BRD67]QKG53932.1 DUF4476 domain-containing protein [Hymenobacter sp. BRD67]